VFWFWHCLPLGRLSRISTISCSNDGSFSGQPQLWWRWCPFFLASARAILSLVNFILCYFGSCPWLCFFKFLAVELVPSISWGLGHSLHLDRVISWGFCSLVPSEPRTYSLRFWDFPPNLLRNSRAPIVVPGPDSTEFKS
jgi:hypothetical protein